MIDPTTLFSGFFQGNYVDEWDLLGLLLDNELVWSAVLDDMVLVHIQIPKKFHLLIHEKFLSTMLIQLIWATETILPTRLQ